MEILNLSTIKSGDKIEGLATWVYDCTKLKNKNGGEYFKMKSYYRGISVSVMVWMPNILLSKLNGKLTYTGPASITGTVKEYNGGLTIHLDSIDILDEIEYPRYKFEKSADINSLYAKFMSFVSTELTPKGTKLIKDVFKNKNICERFKEEYAGASKHDAQHGGLLNHTLKMLRIARTVCENDDRLHLIPDFTDLLYISIIFHDIGKIVEMKDGIYQPNSYVSHRIFGIEMVHDIKNEIVSTYDEDFYYQILDVLQGHHGEFEQKPHTVFGYIIHIIDMLDSQTTGIFDALENNSGLVSTDVGTSIKVNDMYLNIRQNKN